MTRATSFHRPPSGYHHISNNSVEVFAVNTDGRVRWSWWLRSPGHLPTSEAHGAFATAQEAFRDALTTLPARNRHRIRDETVLGMKPSTATPAQGGDHDLRRISS